MMICSGSPSGISSQVMNITSEVTVYMFVQRRTTSQWPSIAAIATMSGSEAASDATKKTGDSDSESIAVTVEIKVRSLKKAVKQAMKKKAKKTRKSKKNKKSKGSHKETRNRGPCNQRSRTVSPERTRSPSPSRTRSPSRFGRAETF